MLEYGDVRATLGRTSSIFIYAVGCNSGIVQGGGVCGVFTGTLEIGKRLRGRCSEDFWGVVFLFLVF